MKTQTRRYAAFLVIGVLLLVISFLATDSAKRPDFWVSTIQNVALIALTVVILEFLWRLAGGDPLADSIAELRKMLDDLRGSIRLLEDSQRTGLRRVYGASGSAGSHLDWTTRLQSARSKIDLMGYSLHVWTKGQDFEDSMIQIAKAGVCVRILVMAPDNPELGAFVNHHQIPGITMAQVTEEIRAATQAFKSIQAKIPVAAGGARIFEVRALKKGLIVTQSCRTDNRLTSVQYLYSAVASRTPLLEVQGDDTELFKVYTLEFERAWELAEPA